MAFEDKGYTSHMNAIRVFNELERDRVVVQVTRLNDSVVEGLVAWHDNNWLAIHVNGMVKAISKRDIADVTYRDQRPAER